MVGFRTLGAAALILALGCAAPRDERPGEGAAAIQGGTTDPRDTAVVGVALADAEGYVRRTCSGTLIAPNLVLTAQHCVADTAPFVDCRSSAFGPLADAAYLRVTTSASMWASDAAWVPVAEVLAPPGAPLVCGRDIALVVLSSPLSPDLASPVPPNLGAPPEHAEGYAAVGYGATAGNADDAGLRRRRDALRVVCVGSACDSNQVSQAEWRGDHGICNGDSGGPAIDDRGFVIGVTSRGPEGCEAPIYGGLVAHAAWLREGGRIAALAAFYPAPPWTVPTAETRGASLASPAGGSGCAASSPGPRPGGAALLTLALALVAARRRR